MTFELGQVVVSRGVDEQMREDVKFLAFVQASLGRYQQCDWGDLEPDDKAMNDAAVKSGKDRILAAYTFHDGGTDTKIWIITEWDHSVTTILFPEEY